MQYRIHMSRCVDQRDDGDVLFFGVGDDAIHLRLGQLAAACSRVSFISGVDGFCHFIMAKAARSAAHYFFFTSSQSQCSCENSFLSGGFCLC